MTHCKRGLVAGILFLAVALTPVAAMSGPFEDARDALAVLQHEAEGKLSVGVALLGQRPPQPERGRVIAAFVGVHPILKRPRHRRARRQADGEEQYPSDKTAFAVSHIWLPA